MTPPTVQTAFFFSRPVREKPLARRILDLILKHAPSYAPTRVRGEGTKWIPIFPLEEFSRKWFGRLDWKTANNKFLADFDTNHRHLHHMISVSQNPASFNQSELFELLSAFAEWPGLDFAYIYLHTPSNRARPDYFTDFDVYTSLITTDLYEGLPLPCWTWYLGPPYVNIIGADHLTSAPCLTNPLQDGHLLRLTDSIKDARKPTPHYIEAQTALYGHLKHAKIFKAADTPVVPDFHLPSPPRRSRGLTPSPPPPKPPSSTPRPRVNHDDDALALEYDFSELDEVLRNLTKLFPETLTTAHTQRLADAIRGTSHQDTHIASFQVTHTGQPDTLTIQAYISDIDLCTLYFLASSDVLTAIDELLSVPEEEAYYS